MLAYKPPSIPVAVEIAQEQFWAAVARLYPHIKTGDFPPDAQACFDQACRDAVQTWITINSGD